MLENRQEHFRNKAGFKPAAWELVTTLPAVTQTLTVQLAIGEKLNEMRLSATSYLEIVLHPTHKNNVQQWKQKWSKWNWKPMKTMTLWLIKRISRKDAREKKQQKLVLTFFFFKFVLQVAITEWVNKWNEGKEHVFTSPSYETYWCFNWTNKKKVPSSSQIWTSDIRMPTSLLQSSALPTELSKERNDKLLYSCFSSI